jgi:hypothetical protein
MIIAIEIAIQTNGFSRLRYTDSGSVCLGSNPGGAANLINSRQEFVQIKNHI